MASCPHVAGKESCPSSSSSSSSSAAGESEYRGVYYGGYLALDQLLSAQRPLTKCHDEVLFIITHQAFELWFKQMILEIGSVIDIFNQPIVPESAMLLAVRRLNRVAEIQRVCVQQFKIMETMTPMEFVDFRDALVPASGFQSYQFREFEVRFGLLEENRTKLRGCRFLGVFLPEHEEYLKEAIKLPNLFSVVEKWLERTPFLDIPEWNFWDEYKAAVHKVIQRDRDHADDEWRINDDSGKNESNEETKKELQALEERFQAIFDPELYEKQRESGQVRLSQRAFKAALLIMLYRQEPLLHLPFEFLEMLIEIDNNVSLFRHAHATMVHRMIGARMGTGGSSGVHYLRSTTGLKYKVFGDLTNVSTYTIPSQSLPALPPNVRAKMNFSNLS